MGLLRTISKLIEFLPEWFDGKRRLRLKTELCFVGGAVPTDVGDVAFSVDADADGVPGVDAAAATAAGGGYGACGFGGLVGEDEFVAALLDAGEIGVRVDGVDVVAHEGGPV